MKSPFPGMDPYLEAHWRDVHARLILYASDQLEPQLPRDLIARVEERVVAVTEPVIVHYESEPATETFIHIVEPGAKQRLVTVIEILSLTNKLPGEGQQSYRQKQVELRRAGVSLVEIDLLRSGKRVLSLPPARIPRRIRTTYQVCVRRGWKGSDYEVYAVPLRRRLPTIRVPLREKDDDARLDLQAVLDLAYRKGRYFSTIDYHQPPDPPFNDSDRAWAKGLFRQDKKRSG